MPPRCWYNWDSTWPWLRRCHRPWYIGGKVSRWISRFAKIALRWCKRWQTVTRIFRHVITDEDRWQILYVVRRTTYYTAFPRRIATSSYPKISKILFRNQFNHTRSHDRNPKDPITPYLSSYVDSGTGRKIRWCGEEHHLRKCARMYEKRVESYALHIPWKQQLKPFLFHFSFKLKLIIFKSSWLLSHVS